MKITFANNCHVNLFIKSVSELVIQYRITVYFLGKRRVFYLE